MDGWTEYLIERDEIELLAIKEAKLKERARAGDECAQLKLILRRLKNATNKPD